MGGGGNSVFEQIIDVVVQSSTGGLAGFKSDEGGLAKGVTGSPLVDVVKEVTGAAAAEQANVDARKRFEEEKARSKKSRQEAKQQSAREQVTASRLAGAARTGGRGTDRGSRFSSLGSDERDFLGL